MAQTILETIPHTTILLFLFGPDLGNTGPDKSDCVQHCHVPISSHGHNPLHSPTLHTTVVHHRLTVPILTIGIGRHTVRFGSLWAPHRILCRCIEPIHHADPTTPVPVEWFPPR